jgi:hypothetical protein
METYPRNFKKDTQNFLNISVDKRNKEFKTIFNQLGSIQAVVENFTARMDNIIEYRKLNDKRKKQTEKIRRKKILTLRKSKSKEKRQRRKQNKVIVFKSAKLKEEVLKLYNNKQIKGAFKVTFISILTSSKFVLNFSTIKQFNLWFFKFTRSQESDSDGKQEQRDKINIMEQGYIKVEALKGGYKNDKAKQISITLSNKSIINCFNPISKRNNCGLACIKHILKKEFDNQKIRDSNNIKAGSIEIQDILTIYNEVKGSNDKPLEIILINANPNNLDFNKYNYMLLYKNHFLVVDNIIDLNSDNYENHKTKRGTLIYDLETRYNLDKPIKVNGEIQYELYDILCCVEYQDYKSTEKMQKHFYSYYNSDNIFISSCSLFRAFLDEQAASNKFYNIWSHNGARFDNYFIIRSLYQDQAINEIEKIQLRGFSVIGMQYNSHLFKDSACFMPNTLDNLSKNFKVKNPKLKEFSVNGKILNNTQLCFYRPELNVKDFLNLRNNDKDFWECYLTYCFADCTALFQIIEAFKTEINSLIEKMNPKALLTCSMMKFNTIGSHAKAIFSYLNENNYHFKDYLTFFDDNEKLLFVNNFKRGGISHCNKKGKHTKGVVSVDITSQYPAAMLHLNIACGKSKWVTEYDKVKYGYYHIKNLKFDNNYFKPACGSNDSNKNSLNWANENIEEDYIDSFMLEYLIKNCGLISFDIVKGLVSNQFKSGNKIFNKYVMTLFDAKAEQDEYKNNNDERYNPALREVIKLYLNSLSGKLVEDPRKYGTIKMVSEETENSKQFNGMNTIKKSTEDLNMLVGLGVMVYSYSKRLLFEYINLLPSKTNNVIATETDSIYFDKVALKEFEDNVKNYKGDYPCEFGNKLGNIKFEKNTDEICYFLGKKFYAIGDVMRIKGISQSTIDDDGSYISLVDISLYEDVFNAKNGGKPITRTMSVLNKTLYGITSVNSAKLTRTINSTYDYNTY